MPRGGGKKKKDVIQQAEAVTLQRNQDLVLFCFAKKTSEMLA